MLKLYCGKRLKTLCSSWPVRIFNSRRPVHEEPTLTTRPRVISRIRAEVWWKFRAEFGPKLRINKHIFSLKRAILISWKPPLIVLSNKEFVFMNLYWPLLSYIFHAKVYKLNLHFMLLTSNLLGLKKTVWSQA